MHGQRRSYIIRHEYLSSFNRKQRINKLSIKRGEKAGIPISSVSRRHRSQDLTRMIVNSAPGNLHPSITYRGVLINVSQKDFKSGRVSNYRLVTTSDRAGIAKINSPDSLAPTVRNKGGVMVDEERVSGRWRGCSVKKAESPIMRRPRFEVEGRAIVECRRSIDEK